LNSKKFIIVLVTAPNLKVARQLAQFALRAKLIACANLVPKIESHYWWQGKIESGNEVLMVMKTTQACVTALEKLVIAKHPYETPEFVVLGIHAGNKRYLKWITDSVQRPQA